MVHYSFPSNISTPQQRRSSDPTWSNRTLSTGIFTPSKSALRTPSSGRKSSPLAAGLRGGRDSAYKSPEKARITLGPGKSCPMDLFTPKDYYKNFQAKEALRRKGASLASSPLTPLTPLTHLNTSGRARMPGRKPKTILFPSSLGVQQLSRTLVSPPMQGTPRRVERPPDPARPTVELFRVMHKCWEDDTEKESDWTLTNALLNGRNDERDRRGIWDNLGYAVANVWPKLHDWIMQHRPSDNDTTWFSSAGRSSYNDEEFIRDPHLATKASTLDRVGFYSS
jgi:hypothetical protein